jgi:hypothetical protein
LRRLDAFIDNPADKLHKGAFFNRTVQKLDLNLAGQLRPKLDGGRRAADGSSRSWMEVDGLNIG